MGENADNLTQSCFIWRVEDSSHGQGIACVSYLPCEWAEPGSHCQRKSQEQGHGCLHWGAVSMQEMMRARRYGQGIRSFATVLLFFGHPWQLEKASWPSTQATKRLIVGKGRKGNHLNDSSLCNLIEYEIISEDRITSLFCFNICIANNWPT